MTTIYLIKRKTSSGGYVECDLAFTSEQQAKDYINTQKPNTLIYKEITFDPKDPSSVKLNATIQYAQSSIKEAKTEEPTLVTEKTKTPCGNFIPSRQTGTLMNWCKTCICHKSAHKKN